MSAQATLRLAGVVRESIVDGPGLRFTVFAQGCPHHCQGCHNESTHDFNGGVVTEIPAILREIDKNPLLSGVTFSGGEPFCQAEGFGVLAKEIKDRGLHVVTFSGYTYEELMELALRPGPDGEAVMCLLDLTDMLIDGRFELALRDLTLCFRGSQNQRLIDMNKTRETGKIVLDDKYMNVI
jgi:anaerobic ribonucleoside-triphosphate reductase activating protein